MHKFQAWLDGDYNLDFNILYGNLKSYDEYLEGLENAQSEDRPDSRPQEVGAVPESGTEESGGTEVVERKGQTSPAESEAGTDNRRSAGLTPNPESTYKEKKAARKGPLNGLISTS